MEAEPSSGSDLPGFFSDHHKLLRSLELCFDSDEDSDVRALVRLKISKMENLPEGFDFSCPALSSFHVFKRFEGQYNVPLLFIYSI